MPSFFRDGRFLAGATGGGQELPSIDNVVIPDIGPVSVPRPWTSDAIVYSQGQHTYALNLITPRGASNPRIVSGAATWLAAGGGDWARRLQSDPAYYADSFGRGGNLPWRPVAVNAQGVLVTNYDTGAGLWFWPADRAMVALLPSSIPVVNAVAGMAGNTWMARLSGTTLAVGHLNTPGNYRTVTIPESSDLAVAGPDLAVVWGFDAASLIVCSVDVNPCKWATLSSGLAYNFDARFVDHFVEGPVLEVCGATTSGEAPGTNWKKGYSLMSMLWATATSPTAPAPPVEPTPPPPAPESVPDRMMLPAAVWATYAAVVAKFPHTGDDDHRREMHKRAVQTVKARHGDQWATKTEHANGWVSQSTDALVFVPGGAIHGERQPMFIWDMINGTTRDVLPAHESEPRRLAYTLAPMAFDWLADIPAPGPEPVPPVEPPPAPVEPPVTPPPPVEDPGDDPGADDGSALAALLRGNFRLFWERLWR